ncbi:MAG: NfeD family protein [Pirellulaceae bacterium]|jgi:membrane-bound ClpP family serine protease|nr:NfeD family protein [Pirellulaceae bacterium]
MNPILSSVLLIVAGFAFIFLELLIPSAGLIGIISAALLLSGIVVGFQSGLGVGFTILTVTLVLLPIVIAFLLKIWPNTPIGKMLFISPPSEEDVVPDPEVQESLESLLGKVGIARSKLLPSGSVTIDGKHYDAVSDGLPIELGQDVKVVKVKAMRIFVRPEIKMASRDTEDPLSQSIESLGLNEIEDPLEK